MSSPKISITPNPAGSTGWFGRVLTGLGVLLVVAAGIAISPAATNAGHGWSGSMRGVQAPPSAAADRSESIDAGPTMRRVARPMLTPPRPEVPTPESVASVETRRADRPALARRLLSAAVDRTKAELDRLRGVVVTASAD
jgi:hypothetical protein